MVDDIFAESFKTDPYWWEAAPRPKLDPEPLPKTCDLAVVGSGFTGLSAALTAARGGRDTVVIEAEDPGYGASTRNAGYVGRTLWHKFEPLMKKHGAKEAARLQNDAVAAHHYVVDLIEKEQIECGFVYCGRFIGASTPRHYDHFATDLEAIREHGVEIEAEMIPKAEQKREIDTDFCHGGLLIHGVGAVHPGLYQLGLMERVRNADARVIANTPVTNVARASGGGFTVTTARGTVQARDVLMATNGYRGAEMGWLQRRIVPVKAYIIATEPLPAQQLKRMMPGGRTFIDSRNNIWAVRLSPDNTRLICFGRTGINDGDLRNKARLLRDGLVAIFPELADVKLTHCWDGTMGFTFDKLPHTGVRDGIHYALGYCGAGLPLGTYLGHKTAQRILGEDDGGTALDERNFPTRPLYFGTPWFLPAMMGYYNMRDRIDLWRG
ncbi:MAG: FAD-binding oxidoreductase [Rhodospirillaceae bacterium]|jgi:glycine/D-amino acid oxidase-like deaminating enzyme|nr:FAD-binding oxidoreductase [Rhodospirillaceae bacterium]